MSDRSGEPEWLPILAFYDADVRRKSPSDIGFGGRWTKDGWRFRLVWFPGTGELCLFRPNESGLTFFNAILRNVGGTSTGSDMDVSVAVLGVVATKDEVDALLDGWRNEMRRPNSLDWLATRIA